MRGFDRRRWRSLLFVPADKASLLQKAATRGADALVIDLEDAVPHANKAMARNSLGQFAEPLAHQGGSILVRVNSHPSIIQHDLAALPASVSAIVLPKVEGIHDIQAAALALDKREKDLGLVPGTVGLIPQIESPRAIRYVYEIAEGPRVVGLSLGTEDFALALGTAPQPECLALPAQMVCLAAAAAGIMALALPISIADFRDLKKWESGVRTARAQGATGALCIHPSQIPILNEVFSPSDEEKVWAEAIVEAWGRSSGNEKGAIAVNGAMIDKPVFQRASAIINFYARSQS